MSDLDKHVREWVSERAQDYDGNRIAVLQDLQRGGCISGFVNHLIYHVDCMKFVNEYWTNIEEVINDISDQCGETNFITDKDGVFSFTRLAWLAFEETANRLLDELESTEEAA